MPDPERTVAWKLEGAYFERCSCEVVCPCTASLALGADVSGLTVAAVADTPKFMPGSAASWVGRWRRSRR